MTGAVPEMARPATKPTCPVLRWHGGKWKFALWVIQFFPEQIYVEPFGGAGSADLPVGVFERDHIAASDSHPLGGHGWSAASHVPGGVGFAEGAF